MRIVLFAILSFFAGFTQAQSRFSEGNAAYEAGNYEEAIQAYSSVVANGEHSAELYYNLGNAYYRNQHIGKAIWAYESALKIDPDHEDALFNLQHVNAQTVDQISSERRGFGHWMKGIIYSEQINLWAIISIICSLLFAISCAFFIFTAQRKTKNLSLLLATLMLLGMFGSVLLASMHKDRLTENSAAVIIDKTIDIKVAPQEDAQTTFILSEGAKVDVLEKSSAEWVKIELNGNQGWLPTSSIWEI